MPGVKARWTGGEQFLATDDAGRFAVTDGAGQGFKPPDLLLTALVGCAGIDVVRILEKKRQAFTAIEARVEKTNALEAPWPIEKIELEWVVTGRGLKEKAVCDSIRLAQERYCSVFASLKSEIVTTIRIAEEGQEPVLVVPVDAEPAE